MHVQGAAGNRTDLTVALYPLKDPDQETIFENCVADVNIPAGEVFTSPVLKGTNGTLHVSHVFLNGYEFRDLEIRFEDGMIARADCGNFENEDENQAFIRENIDGVTELTFDFSSLDYISSAGLRVLLLTQKRMNAQGTMKVTNVNDTVSEIFEVTGFSDILTIA